MIYVTDTHALVFAATSKRGRLGRNARRIFQASNEGRHSIVVPVTVLEEVMRLIEKRVIRLKVPFSRLAAEMDDSPNFQVQPYTLEILLEAEGLSSIRDPADRVIVATARHLGCALISADEVIQDGGWVETVWE
ncbi:MAG: type II toxin-antitoxin system VapC family toxin [Candidatus Binatia bacterium]